ncbi:hypothetical protein D3C86_1365880 [compost metagenome]
MLAQEDQEERRGVDRAVVGVVGNLLEARQLSDPQLVEDLAGLFVAPIVHAPPLVLGKQPQGLLGDVGVVGEGLERRDQAVPAEQGRVPGHSGREVALALEPAAQHVQIPQGLGHDPVQ